MSRQAVVDALNLLVNDTVPGDPAYEKRRAALAPSAEADWARLLAAACGPTSSNSARHNRGCQRISSGNGWLPSREVAMTSRPPAQSASQSAR